MSKAKDVFSTLVSQIEKLSGKQFSDSMNEEKIDIEKVRRYEAKLAAREIAQQRLENHKNFVNSYYQQGILDSKDVFETFVQDNCNHDAFLCAQSFTQSINPTFLSSAKEISSRPSLLLLLGNPGTGKTTVARLIARIYKCLGLLSKGQLIETDRSGLVAGYVGQTAIKTQEVINNALGGVLFIDEAYTLSNGGDNDFGQEAIDTLLKAMEDRRDDLVVIVAGYDDLMDEFVHSNPGLESRFNRYIHFSDYTAEQLLEIFEGLCKKNQYKLSDDAKDTLTDYLDTVDVGEIGNGRGVRNIFEKVVTQQARRVETSDDPEIDLSIITVSDIIGATGKG